MRISKSFESNLERLVREEIEARGYRRGIDFSCQYPLRYSFILDFAFPDAKLAIEVDGEHWHSSSKDRRRDRIKDKVLKKAGWEVIRFSENEVLSNCSGCVDKIERTVSELKRKRFL
jgi:very-short-patch-repair endonuclease